MNTMNRLLTRRDKNGLHRRSKSSDVNDKTRPTSTGIGILSLFNHDVKKDAKGDSKKVQAIKQKLRDRGMTMFDESQIEYALQTQDAGGDPDKAQELLLLFQESVEGIVRPYDYHVYMQGAENRENVTCYLDSLLFAMFARLGSFEPILYTTFDDEPRRRLSTLIRIWVNMLRAGKLIQTDITKHIQEALAACGWEEAANIEQQDTSEAFGFITEALRLPLLTLEMDIFHEGTGDAADDHKFINERLLEVAIPSEPGDGQAIKLEDCLEEYFNTRIEVVRRLGRRDTLKRSNTTASIASGLSTVDEKGGTSEHVEHAEVQSPLPITPVLQNSIPQFPSTTTSETSSTRRRATSIIRHRVIPETETGESSVGNSDTTSTHSSTRKTSIRKEVLMPAWQFFRIIPWYTANVPANDVQVAQHFVSTRPVLGICLKRYAMSPNGQPVRRDTPIDIPLQIALPHFIQDDKAADGGPLFGNFNLVLQSVVCHRGVSVNSGHYISIIRGTSQRIDQKPKSAGTENTDGPPEYEEDTWIKFDDLASERVTYVDIEKAMVEEMPYLLFYQVRPLFEEPPSDDFSSRPPSYVDSGIGMTVSGSSPVIKTNPNPEIFSRSSYFENFAMDEPSKPRISFSDDVVEHPRNSLNIDGERRGSLAFTDGSTASVHTNSVPVTPGEETTSVGRLSRATSRFARSSKSKSRPTSHVDESRASMNESRLSATFSKLNLRKNSKDPLKDPLRASVDSSVTEVNSIIPNLDGAADTRDGYSSTDLEAEIQLPPVQEGGMGFGGGKNKRKSKTIEGQHHHTHGSKGKGKIKEGGEPDRECIVM